MRRNQPYSPSPSVVEPRRELLLAVLSFVRTARTCPGVLRIALMGSLATSKAIPKDADLLVTINDTMDLGQLAHWPAPQGVCSNHQSRRRHLPRRCDWTLPRSHLPLSRVPSTRSMSCPTLRAPRASQ